MPCLHPRGTRPISLRQAMADIRAALDWSLVRGGDISLGVDLASAATPVFLRLSLLREHRKHLDLALAHISASADTVPMTEAALRSEMALRTAMAQAAYYTEGPETAPEKQLLKAREIAQKIGDKAHELKVLWMLYGHGRQCRKLSSGSWLMPNCSTRLLVRPMDAITQFRVTAC